MMKSDCRGTIHQTEAHTQLGYRQIGVHTDVLSQEGSDLTVAWKLLLKSVTKKPWPNGSKRRRGARVRIEEHDTLLSLARNRPTCRARSVQGNSRTHQLQFLCLSAALLSPGCPRPSHLTTGDCLHPR